MATHYIFTIVLIVFSINAIAYLKTYITIQISGIKISGVVVAYEVSNSILNKNMTIPKIRFQTPDETAIIGMPVNSWFLELNNYQIGNSYEIIYDKREPSKFVMKGSVDLWLCSVILAGTLISIAWLIIEILWR